MGQAMNPKQSIFQALISTFRRARISLYQPFVEPLPPSSPAPLDGPHVAKVIPFSSARHPVASACAPDPHHRRSSRPL